MKKLSGFNIGDVYVDARHKVVCKQGQNIPLKGTALTLLNYFVENANALLTRDNLLVSVWGYNGSNITRTVDMHVSKLRKAIEPDPRNPKHIITVQGKGYKFIPPRDWAISA